MLFQDSDRSFRPDSRLVQDGPVVLPTRQREKQKRQHNRRRDQDDTGLQQLAKVASSQHLEDLRYQDRVRPSGYIDAGAPVSVNRTDTVLSTSERQTPAAKDAACR